MKIFTGQFNDSYFPIMDGVGMTAHNYAYWLNRKYGRSVVVAPKVKGYEDHSDYQVYRFKSLLLPGMNPYRVGLPMVDVKFKKRLKKEKFDLIHAHCPFVSGQLAMKMARKLNIPLVTTFHTKYREDFKKVFPNDQFVDFLVNMTLDFYRNADLVLVPNKGTAETLRDYGFQGNYEIMRNGSDMQIPDKGRLQKERKKGMEAIGSSSEDFVLLFVGQLRKEKNVFLIMEALKNLHKSGVPFKMVFVGEGYSSSELKNLAVQYQLSDKIVFPGVITDRSKLQNIYAVADLFVFPSIYDNSPLVIQEAAAYNIPSVVVKNSSASEGIVDGVNGYTVENDVDDLVNKLQWLIFHPLQVKWTGEGARKSLHHPWEEIVDDVYQRYVDLIKEHTPKTWRQSDDDEESDIEPQP